VQDERICFTSIHCCFCYTQQIWQDCKATWCGGRWLTDKRPQHTRYISVFWQAASNMSSRDGHVAPGQLSVLEVVQVKSSLCAAVSTAPRRLTHYPLWGADHSSGIGQESGCDHGLVIEFYFTRQSCISSSFYQLRRIIVLKQWKCHWLAYTTVSVQSVQTETQESVYANIQSTHPHCTVRTHYTSQTDAAATLAEWGHSEHSL